MTWSYWSSNKSDWVFICDRPGGFEAILLLLGVKPKNESTVTLDGLQWSTQAGDKGVTVQKASLNLPVCNLCAASRIWIGNEQCKVCSVWPGCYSLRQTLDLNSEISLAAAEMLENVPPQEWNDHLCFVRRYRDSFLSAALSLIWGASPSLAKGFCILYSLGTITIKYTVFLTGLCSISHCCGLALLKAPKKTSKGHLAAVAAVLLFVKPHSATSACLHSCKRSCNVSIKNTWMA